VLVDRRVLPSIQAKNDSIGSSEAPTSSGMSPAFEAIIQKLWIDLRQLNGAQSLLRHWRRPAAHSAYE
jgi:hypothetical protein